MPIALFFDMWPKPGHLDAYFEHVERLRPHLARHDGLLEIERFRRLDDPDAILSHQIWRDAEAILGWRRDREHRVSQAAGRNVHFADYRIRVGPACSTQDTADGRLVMTFRADMPIEAATGTQYESVTQPGHFITVATAENAEAARATIAAAPANVRSALYRIERDYGMTARAEAPAPE